MSNFINLERFLKMEHANRYEYCISEISFLKTLWMAQTDDGLWVLVKDPDGNILVPLWASLEVAQAVSHKIDASSIPVKVDLDDFKDQWVRGLINDDYNLAVFPVFNEDNDLEIIYATPLRLLHDIKEGESKLLQEKSH